MVWSAREWGRSSIAAGCFRVSVAAEAASSPGVGAAWCSVELVSRRALAGNMRGKLGEDCDVTMLWCCKTLGHNVFPETDCIDHADYVDEDIVIMHSL